MQKYKHNEEFFNTWSNDMAYILGFIMADGSVYKNTRSFRLKISIHEKDKEILEFIRDKISPEQSIKKIKNKIKNGFSAHVMLTVVNSHMCKKLIELGVVQNKTYNCKWKKIPKKYIPQFLLGYFDGDGSIYKKGKGFEFVIDVKKIKYLTELRKHTLKLGAISKGHGTYRWRIGSNKELLQMKNYLYSNHTFCLKRKYFVFNQIKPLKVYTAFNETKNLYQWSKDPRCHVSYSSLSRRLKKYTDFQNILTAKQL